MAASKNHRTKAPDISTFSARVKHDGISKQNRFYVEMALPRILTTTVAAADLELISLYVEQSQFPEMAIATQTVHSSGMHVEMPYDKMFGQVGMTFVCDRDMVIKTFFDTWISAVLDSRGGVFNYYDDYVVPVLNIYQHDDNNDVVYCVSLYNAYPKIVNDMILSSQSRDHNRFQVVFAYEQWESTIITAARSTAIAIDTMSTGKFDKLGNPRKAGQIAQMIANGSPTSRSSLELPGIDLLSSVTGISSGLDALNKMKNPKLLRDSLLRSSRAFSMDAMKPFKEKILSSLPGQIRQIGGSALGQLGKKMGF